jgi:hypothetical protein
MSLSVQLGLLLALATTFTSVVGFLHKHRGAVESPTVEMRRPVRSSLVLFKSRWYTLGILVAVGSWALHVAALSLAPISLVQSVIAGGLVLLTVTADRLFGQRVTRRGGSASLQPWDSRSSPPRSMARPQRPLGLRGCTAGAVGRRPGDPGAGRRRDQRDKPPARHRARRLGWALLGCLRHADPGAQRSLGDGAASVLLSPLAAVIALASFAGLVVSAKSLQIGKAVPVIAVTSVAANVFTIAAGPIVFGEPLPDTSLGLLVRLLAFALVISAAALTPAPARAAHLEPS